MNKIVQIIIFLAAIINLNNSFGQDYLNRRHSTETGCQMDFYILLSEKKIRYKDSLEYYWFRSQKIHMTQGGAAGVLLDGPFNKFYENGQLFEKGNYKKGLKSGQWTAWYETGFIRAIYHYKKGRKKGKFIIYDEFNRVVEKGKYRGGRKKVKTEKEKKRKEINDSEENDTEQNGKNKKFDFKAFKEKRQLKKIEKQDSTQIKREKTKKRSENENH